MPITYEYTTHATCCSLSCHPRESLVAVTAGGAVSVYDVDNGGSPSTPPLKRFTLSGLENDSGGDVAWSPDGSRVAAVSCTVAKVWDFTTGKTITLELPANVWHGVYPHVAFSPDGTRIATTVALIGTRIWDAKTGKRLFDLGNNEYVPNWRSSVSWSPDGHTILVMAGRPLLYSAATGRFLGISTADGGEGAVDVGLTAAHGAWVADGRCILVNSSAHQWGLSLWDPASGRFLARARPKRSDQLLYLLTGLNSERRPEDALELAGAALSMTSMSVFRDGKHVWSTHAGSRTGSQTGFSHHRFWTIGQVLGGKWYIVPEWGYQQSERQVGNCGFLHDGRVAWIEGTQKLVVNHGISSWLGRTKSNFEAYLNPPVGLTGCISGT